MRLGITARLTLIVATITLAFFVVVMSGVITSTSQREDISELEGRLVPKLSLGPRLEAETARMQRALQDAVAAQDRDALNAVTELKAQLIAHVQASGNALDPEDAQALVGAIDAYFAVGHDVSRRLIAGETGEDLAAVVAQMQQRREQLASALARAIRFDQRALSSSFAKIRDAADNARRINVVVGLCSLLVVITLSLWAGRGVLSAVRLIAQGFARFATGDFTQPIVVSTPHELGDVANAANTMAASLRTHADERARADWLRTGQVELSNHVRGELDPRKAAQHAISFLVRWVGGVAGAIYLAEGDRLRLAAHHGLSEETPDPVSTIRVGEGLLGQALASDRVTVIANLPSDYLRVRSGLGDGTPQSLVLTPLTRAGQAIGAMEIALFGPCSDQVVELLTTVRELLTAKLLAALSQHELKTLLLETQQQAELLATQEEELRRNNQDLRAHQNELQEVNTELEAQRAALREQNVALDAANQQVEAKAAEIAKVSSYKSQFLANMSHELRTPLNSMLLLSHLMSENEGKNLSAKQVEYCQTIHAAGKDLMGLINQVLDLAKIESGKQQIYVETVPLIAVVDQMQRLFGPVAAEKRLAFEVEIASDLPESIATDRKRLEQILINLLGNAIKFTERGRVALRIRRPDAHARLQRSDLALADALAFEVSDTGIGVPIEAQQTIFLPFEQVEARTDRRYGGTGLGLAIAKESVHLLGGELQLESIPQRGSTFTCYLPAAHADKPVQRANVVRVRSEATPIARKRSTQLLIIEDDQVFAELLADIARARTLDVMVATTGAEGLRLAREARPQGIVLDVRLPDIEGWSVMEQLRRDPLTSDIPVHFVSALDAKERGFAMGAVGYLTKPTTRDDLHDLVNTMITASDQRPRRVLVVEDNSTAAQSIVSLLSKDHLDTLHVSTANAALEALAAESFGCMLLDLGLPDLDGLRLLELLERRRDTPTPPVIVYTGRTLTRDEIARLGTYAQSVVMKDGYSEQRLLDEVHLFVQQVKRSTPTSLRAAFATGHAASVSLTGMRLLIVDDDMRALYALSALLRSKGAEVFAADNGRFALELLADNPNVHGVLMDIMMPEMDGYEAIRRIRAQPRFAKLPIMALTAKAMKGERERCIEIGASDYHPKPVDGPVLLTTIRSWLQES